MGKRGSACVFALQRVCACLAAVLYVCAHVTAAATCRSTRLSTAANVTIFPTDALTCTESPAPDGITGSFLLWSLKDQGTGYVSIVVAAPLDVGQWVALGFSEQGEMIKSTAIIVWIARGLPRVRTYYLRDKVESAVVPDATRITFVAGPELSYDSKQKTVFMAFQIDFAKSLAKPNFLLYAQGQESADDAPMQHNVQWMDKSSFPTGSVGESAADKLQKRVRTHGALQVFGWGILLPIGVLFARYAKSLDPAWFYIHITFQMIGFIFVIAGLGTGVSLANEINVHGLAGHKGLGFFLFALAILQVLAVIARPGKDAKLRKYWNWYHWWVGRLALFLACINIFVGLNLTKNNRAGTNPLKTSYIILLVLELVVFAILEALYWFKWNRSRPVNTSGTSLRWNPTDRY
ncbi:cytochrome b561 and DOMON domain-containing protein At3g07570 [Physcomitrium patens]|uniref:Cytochrome b561 and DOMON domain-containing protein n=1 Tax=Physcomitrium patens TaxID=3218 RepID=A0A2K1KMG9_PHYPA|nr:cytochrome b561 and DOMON domain-containing protein At3g07570-like [Physcomitrium patens]PNR54978.1 hypothetical protein PHYPA_005871 [Physcomitrium patens]|eukprot:XP_024373764.1 cytochrome b561 and DOMON domain-containing protein At3g07570-like [Physcomitrella patens]